MDKTPDQMKRGEFLKNYGNLVANVWENSAVLERLQADPPQVLASFGLPVPLEAQVDLTIQPAEEVNEDALPDAQYALWLQGVESGRFALVVPRRPVDFDEDMGIPLRDEVLDLIAGGNVNDLPACCPCCSCEDAAVN